MLFAYFLESISMAALDNYSVCLTLVHNRSPWPIFHGSKIIT